MGSTDEVTHQDMLAPDCYPHAPQASWAGYFMLQLEDCMLLDLHAVGWGEGPIALVTPLNASRVTVGFKKATFSAPILPM